MIKEFEKLSSDEQKLLFMAPALVSLLVASRAHEISKVEKSDAIQLAHLRTFTSPPLLQPYYNEVDKHFKENFESLTKQYAPLDDQQIDRIHKRIDVLNSVIAKLDKEFAETLHESLTSYAEHVKTAYKGVLVNFIFPYPIPGLSS